ncbi:MAG: GNAT family N-acetyltransferase [Dehalococcoidia bacterium]|nr:GNAT family N-acetyltransferase [Dehalococcoidia bacterium]
MTVTIAPVEARDLDAFFAMLRAYMAELDRYDPETADAPFDVDRYRDAMQQDTEGREFLWILEDGARAGLAIVRTLPDFPDDTRTVASIGEFYVTPAHRRRGVGTAAVEALLAEHRRRGTDEVGAGILAGNAPALAFWARLGFATRTIYTSRRP